MFLCKNNIGIFYFVKYCFLAMVLLSFISCKEDIDHVFNKLIIIEENNYEKTFPSIDLQNIKDINNIYYKKLIKKGKSINDYLLEKAYSEEKTNWYNYPFYFNMSEGDIAIKLLLDINKDINFYKIIPMEIIDEYDENGAKIWWDYLRVNREEIIELIKENI
ncbi:MAG: hypothetical protein LBQ89_08300 [Treponema sp.]|jgi:hypothetical protein|nr:hypothetical protein [Treponema sp.]